nr:MAG TPA: hypothetical protein [Caudoviricetes sp.]
MYQLRSILYILHHLSNFLLFQPSSSSQNYRDYNLPFQNSLRQA